ncbi:MAG: calcium/sodium antiporter [Muribaculaceae bacterium]
MIYLYLILGLALLLGGANYMVEASVAIARRARLSNFVIGLTIVGVGTSAPELLISLSGALSGHGDLAVGNVIGSNITNVLLILGATAAIFPFLFDRATYRRDLPFALFATLIMLILANDAILFGASDNRLSQLDGALLLVLFASYMIYVVRADRKNGDIEDDTSVQTTAFDRFHIVVLCAIVVVSLGALIGGGQLFLKGAVACAQAWGMSEAAIAITVVAVGTSLPELITSVVAACKHNAQLAMGNVLGSNLFNILMILGVSSVAAPIQINVVGMFDYLMMLISLSLVFVFVFTFGAKRFDRVEGIILLLTYIGYTTYLLAFA